MNYHNLILDLIEYNPSKHRFDCFECNRSNSLAIYNQDGELSYYCYGNGCKVRGRHRQRLTIANIFDRRNKKIIQEQEFVCPDYWTQGLNREEVRKYLISVNSFDAAVEGRVNIRYDAKQNRCVFLIYDDTGILKNAVGRALSKNDNKKWHVYGQERYPLIVGKKDICCIVEDAPSAIRISHLVTGLALLGTDLSTNYIGKLREYKKVYVCLDRDAQRKALKMAHELDYFADVSIMLLSEDFKNLDEEHLKEFLGRHFDLESVEDL